MKVGSARAVAAVRHKLIEPVLRKNRRGVAVRTAARLVCASLRRGRAGADYSALAARVRGLSAATLERWTRKYLDGGIEALVPHYKGRVRKSYGWEARALAVFQSQTLIIRPAASAVASRLRQEGYDSATDDRVRRHLQRHSGPS